MTDFNVLILKINKERAILVNGYTIILVPELAVMLYVEKVVQGGRVLTNLLREEGLVFASI